ncbi:replication initiation protein [Sporosarcina siberiensis]|uniref:Replication initiation protein n=1 Tax=Sporosarcina siberiensis TaxID=1365606 RepID=A0ABW4SAK8_9BACL
MNDIKLSKDFLVTLHNDLVQARFSDALSLNEQKILFAVLSNIQPPEFDIDENGKRVIKKPIKEIEPFRVPIKDFTEWLEFKDPNYSAFKNTIKKLMKKIIEIQQEDGSWEMFQWVTKSSYIAKEGVAEIKLSPELYPYLLNLENNFTTTKLNILLSFKSIYSSRLYQLVKKWEKIGSWKVEVEELKNLLGVPVLKEVNGKKEFKLAQYGHFKQRALEVSLKEVNEHSEFDVKMIEHKTVRKITSLSFIIKRKNTKSNTEPGNSPKSSQVRLEGQAESDMQKGKERFGMYAESFKKAYGSKDRKYFNRLTGENVLFDDDERVKAIILNNIFESIGNDACYAIEELLLKIINVGSFDISREIHTLFEYTRNAETINNPEAFIISKLKSLVENVLKGKTGIEIKDIINIRKQQKVERLPDWWFEGEKSKREIERKQQIQFELGRLGDSNLALKDAEIIELMISLNTGKEDKEIDQKFDNHMAENYQEYKRLKGMGILERLMEEKKEELQSLGYLNSNGKISEDIVMKIYQGELEVPA